MMGLAPHLGRQQAHDLVYEACREALGQGRSLLDILKSNQAVAAALSEERLSQLCDPANYLGTAPRMTDEIVRRFHGA
jgi:3-carboxy-cis,cis-muconate cycloisomerase